MTSRDVAARSFQCPPPPCELGCNKLEYCSNHEVACDLYRAYVTGQKVIDGKRIPTTRIFNSIYPPQSETTLGSLANKYAVKWS